MNKKKFLSAKKIFWTLIFFSIIFFNWEKIFAEENKNLNKKLQEIKNEIIKLDKWKNYCDDLPKKNSKKSAYEPINNISDSFDETFFKEKYQISEEWINARNKFLDDVSVWWFKEIVDSFTIQFSWNYCYQRDLQKIDKLLYWSIDFWAKLAEKCQTWSVLKIENIIWITSKDWKTTPTNSIKMLKKNFEKEEAWQAYYEEKYYWATNATSCEEDSITDATKKIKKLWSKFSNIWGGISNWWWLTIKFFKNIWDMLATIWTNKTANNDLKKFLDKIEKDAKKEAESYLTENLNKTLQWLWIKAIIDEKWKKENIFETITRVWKNQINKLKKLFSDNENNNSVKMTWDIKNFLNKTELKKQKSDYAKYAKENFDENQIFNKLEEDATDKIVANIKWLEIDIIRSNWNKKELGEIKNITKKVLKETEDKDVIKEFKKIQNEWTWSKDLKTLKNFIMEFSKFLWKHNEAAWTVESKWILNYWWKNDYN